VGRFTEQALKDSPALHETVPEQELDKSGIMNVYVWTILI